MTTAATPTKPKKLLTPDQEREHARLRGHNVTVYVVDNVAEGKHIVTTMCAGLRL